MLTSANIRRIFFALLFHKWRSLKHDLFHSQSIRDDSKNNQCVHQVQIQQTYYCIIQNRNKRLAYF